MNPILNYDKFTGSAMDASVNVVMNAMVPVGNIKLDLSEWSVFDLAVPAMLQWRGGLDREWLKDHTRLGVNEQEGLANNTLKVT